MENRTLFIAIAVSAIVSSICTAAVMNLSSNSSHTTQSNDLSLVQSQVKRLENNLSIETQARISLQQQLANINSNNIGPAYSNATEQIISEEERSPDLQIDGEQAQQDAQRDAIQRFREERRAERLARQQPGYRQQQLVSAGFAQEEAARIVQIESEESLRELQAQYDFRRQRAEQDRARFSNNNPIREELGEQNYERYLEANGLPTTARVGSVIGGSPGENAGLRAGDEVISYAGERVFNLREVNNLTVQGEVGESVLIEVERDGEPLQLTIPRGPIGISSSGRRRFNR